MANAHVLLTATTTGAGPATMSGAPNTVFQCAGTTTSGSGAASVRVEVSTDKSNWVTLGTISLTLGTTSTSDGFASSAVWPFVRGYVDSISGTAASITLTMGI